MLFSYFDMLSGVPLKCPKVGCHVKSPTLKQLFPESGISCDIYNFFLHLMVWDKSQILDFYNKTRMATVSILENDKLNEFDVLTLPPVPRSYLTTALSFFITEKIEWNAKLHRYDVLTQDNPSEQNKKDNISNIYIDRHNFPMLKRAILQLNYLELDDSDVQTPTYASGSAKELWKRAQDFLKKQAKTPEDNPQYHLGNIISKVCAIHPTYNLTNIFDLTIFQLYDSFFQLGYMRSMNLTERVYSNYGGDDFKFENWLNPILKNI